MRRLREISTGWALAALLSGSVAVAAISHAAAGETLAAAPTSAAAAVQPAPTACLVVETDDALTRTYAKRLEAAITASGTFTLASAPGQCGLQLHVPGNLLRFQTAGGVMVSTAVIVTTASGHYLSASISACEAKDLRPCAARAVAAARLALMMREGSGA